MRIEDTILNNLIHNDEYCRKVVPFIKAEYFQDRTEKIIFEELINCSYSTTTFLILI